MTLVLNADLKEVKGCNLKDTSTDGDGITLIFDCGHVLRSLIIYADEDDLGVEMEEMENRDYWDDLVESCVDRCLEERGEYALHECEEQCGV